MGSSRASKRPSVVVFPHEADNPGVLCIRTRVFIAVSRSSQGFDQRV